MAEMNYNATHVEIARVVKELYNLRNKVDALTEQIKDVDRSVFEAHPKYDMTRENLAAIEVMRWG